MPIAEIPVRLSKQRTAAQDVSTAQYSALTDSSIPRQWWTPDANGWNGNPLSLTGATGIGEAFDRLLPNQQYVKACQDGAGGRLADRMVSKMAVDYLASMERAYRAQYASSVRCRAHAAARRSGHGDDNGPYGAFISHLTDVLATGYAAAGASG